MISIASDNSMFFYKLSESDVHFYNPICMVAVAGTIRDVCWNDEGDKLLIAL